MTKKAQKVIGPKSRYKVLYGGRGGGKSFAFADGLISKAVFHPLRILCTREMQNSIRDSVHRLLSDRIRLLELEPFFNIQRESITSKVGSEFIFKGLRHNISEIKSTEGIDICWVEEAEKVSRDSWDILIPTIRKENSEIWVSFNPDDEKSATYQKFVVNPPPDCLCEFLTYEDNKFFPKVLMKELEYDKRVDYEKYLHVWGGRVKRYGAEVIFAGKFTVEEFDTPIDAEFKFGQDFGFSQDPTAFVRCFIKGRELFIDYEAYGHGVEIEDLPTFMSSVPEAKKWRITADSARPDTISYLKRQGFLIEGAEKAKGSVEDGIQFLRSFERIVIHPRCKGTITDFENYRWKKDRITNEILPVPLDKSNHAVDALRYALEQYCKAKVPQVVWL